MIDAELARAQSLHWEIEALRQLGASRKELSAKRREAARLLEQRAQVLLERGDATGFIDLFAAITYWGEAGERDRAEALLSEGHRRANAFPDGAENLRQEIEHLRAWIKHLCIVPPLRAFARPLPPLPRMAA